MPTGDDHLQKKRSKAVRKRMRRVGADSLEAIQGVQAAKRRRKSGTRRACEGMCYSLPTPDDPFNDRTDRRKRRQENRKLRSKVAPKGVILEFETYADIESGSQIDLSACHDKQLKKRKVSEDSEKLEVVQDMKKRGKIEKVTVKEQAYAGEHYRNGNGTDKSLKYGRLLVNNPGAAYLSKEGTDLSGSVISKIMLATMSESRLLIGDPVKLDYLNGEATGGAKRQGSVFGRQCQAALARGVDVVAVSSLGWDDRAFGYIVSTAVHIKAHQSKDVAPHKPLVLILVASEAHALQVRCVCKPLKTLGISSVCVHPGTRLTAQIRGLSMLTPEIMVATPERLVELLEKEALSVSKVSFLVIDGLDEIIDKGFQLYLNKLRNYLSQGPQKLIICDKLSKDSVAFSRQFVVEPVEWVVSQPSLESSSAFIVQEVSVFTSAAKRLPKLLKVLQQLRDKHEISASTSALILVKNVKDVKNLIVAIQAIGCAATGLAGLKDGQFEQIRKELSDGSAKTLVTTEAYLGQIPLERISMVINYDFPSTMRVYEKILTSMARHSVHGVLHSFFMSSMGSVACDLVGLLRKCLEEVSPALQMLADAAPLVPNGKQ